MELVVEREFASVFKLVRNNKGNPGIDGPVSILPPKLASPPPTKPLLLASSRCIFATLFHPFGDGFRYMRLC